MTVFLRPFWRDWYFANKRQGLMSSLVSKSSWGCRGQIGHAFCPRRYHHIQYIFWALKLHCISLFHAAFLEMQHFTYFSKHEWGGWIFLIFHFGWVSWNINPYIIFGADAADIVRGADVEQKLQIWCMCKPIAKLNLPYIWQKSKL